MSLSCLFVVITSYAQRDLADPTYRAVIDLKSHQISILAIVVLPQGQLSTDCYSCTASVMFVLFPPRYHHLSKFCKRCTYISSLEHIGAHDVVSSTQSLG